MKKLGIVILNYMNWEDTVECMDSLQEQTNKNFDVIIVDNFSNNSSYEILAQKYKKYNNIHILRTSSNLGFARGNNVGIKYCIKNLGIEQILIVNNDTIFVDSNYIDYLLNYKIDDNVGALGTKIIGSDGRNQNPIRTSVSSLSILKAILALYVKKVGLGKILIMNRKRKEKRQSKNKKKSTNEYLINERYVLHGSAIYLTENYLKRVNGFYPKTFLYYEENILALLMDKLNLKMIYIDEINIYHKEDQSSALSFNNENKTRNKFELASAKIALKAKYTETEKLIKIINND